MNASMNTLRLAIIQSLRSGKLKRGPQKGPGVLVPCWARCVPPGLRGLVETGRPFVSFRFANTFCADVRPRSLFQLCEMEMRVR
jgi:hypothetical protein